MPVVNNNLKMVDLPIWEQLQSAPVATSAGACMCDDNERYVYYLVSSTNFWRYDSWSNTWQQLANPTGTVGAGTRMIFNRQVGGQFNNTVYGSIYALIGNGTVASIFQKYDVATNSWTTLNVTNLPATFGTDSTICYPEPSDNNNAGGFTGAVSVTLGASAIIGATSLTVVATTKAMPIGTVLNFGTRTAPLYAVLTASASIGATTLAVSPLISALTDGQIAYYADNIYLIGNATTAFYRYSVGTATWSTTADISGTPALAVALGASGAGCGLKWLSGIDPDYLFFVRGGATANIYRYQLSTNTWSTVTFHPATETFTTGTVHATRKDANGKNNSWLIQKDTTLRIYEFIPTISTNLARLDPKITQFILATSTAVVGDKMGCMKSPDGIEFCYLLLHTSTGFLRSPLFF